jgi:uncharacterized protein YjiS (DUF1127 family)
MSTYVAANKARVAGVASHTAGHGHRKSVAEKVLDTLAMWRERARQRRDLQRLSDRDLRDIGLDRATAMREASKPFWAE